MNMRSDLNRRTFCRRCGGCFLPDQDGDLFCLMCGRPEIRPSWQLATLGLRPQLR
jgi:hypothetical protein